MENNSKNETKIKIGFGEAIKLGLGIYIGIGIGAIITAIIGMIFGIKILESLMGTTPGYF